MANEFKLDYESDNTVYVVLRNAAGKVLDGTVNPYHSTNSWVDWNDDNVDDYDLALVNKGGDHYVGNMPADTLRVTDAGRYDVQAFLQAGANPAGIDGFIGSEEIEWNGTAEIPSNVTAANKFKLDYESDNTVYVVLRNAAGKVLDGTVNPYHSTNSWVDWNDDNVDDYDLALVDKGGDHYVGNMPTDTLQITDAGRYDVQAFLQMGANPAGIDGLIGSEEIKWRGTAEAPSDVTPTGQIGKAMVNLRNLVAESAAFQDAIGAEGTPEEKIAAAKLRLHLTAYEAEEYVRPFGLIVNTGNNTDEGIASGEFAAGGDLELRFEDDITEEYKDDAMNAELDFLNFAEAVIADCRQLSSQPGYFAINNIDVIEGPQQYETEADVYVYGIRYNVNWGLSS